MSTLRSTCVNLNLVALNLDDELKQLIQTFNLHKKEEYLEEKEESKHDLSLIFIRKLGI